MKALLNTLGLALGALTVAAAWLVTLSLPSSASTCADRDLVLITLAENYGEKQSGYGLAANSAMVELFTAPTGSWTLLVTYPNGGTCVIASGQAWETVPPVKPGTEG